MDFRSLGIGCLEDIDCCGVSREVDTTSSEDESWRLGRSANWGGEAVEVQPEGGFGGGLLGGIEAGSWGRFWS